MPKELLLYEHHTPEGVRRVAFISGDTLYCCAEKGGNVLVKRHPKWRFDERTLPEKVWP